MTDYRHGPYTEETPTSVAPPRYVSSAMPVVVGTAPGPVLGDLPINEPVIIYDYEEFVLTFGMSDDYEKYTLCEFAYCYLKIYRLFPVVFINVYDPAVHKVGENSDPSAVDGDDIIGGVDEITGDARGLELLDEIYSRFSMLPGQLVAPGFSDQVEVAIAMYSAAGVISDIFKCHTVVDSPEILTRYTDVNAYKNEKSLLNKFMQFCWPNRCRIEDRYFRYSTHYACVVAQTDAEVGGIPYRSPSNQPMKITGLAAAPDGKEILLDIKKANLLNSQGVTTAINFNGWRVWGPQTSAYPATTDVKDADTAIRRFFSWHENTFVLTYFSRVDWPLTRPQVSFIVDSETLRMNDFTSNNIILGGQIEFQERQNPTLNLMDGLTKYKIKMCPPSTNKAIIADYEYDPKYLQTLFSKG